MKKKVLFYCQSLWGVGHLVRTLRLCEALLQDYDVYLLDGSRSWGRTLNHQRFVHILLPSFESAPNSLRLSPSDGSDKVENVWIDRRNEILKLNTEHFEALVTEYFPFAREKFTQEFLHLKQMLKSTNPNLKVFCSIRDICNRHLSTDKNKVKKILDQHFDAVFIHGLEKYSNIPQCSAQVPYHYTGYVSSSKFHLNSQVDDKLIIINSGGGRFFEDFFKLIEPQIDLLRKRGFKIVLIPGPFANKKNVLNKNFQVLSHTKDIEEYLPNCALFIGNFGYNTALSLIKFQTPSLIMPYPQFEEQRIRWSYLSPYFPALIFDDKTIIEQSLKKLTQIKPTRKLDLSGASTFRDLIFHLM